jgi:hypothetical protein
VTAGLFARNDFVVWRYPEQHRLAGAGSPNELRGGKLNLDQRLKLMELAAARGGEK